MSIKLRETAMGIKKHQEQEKQMVEEALRIGPQSDRRRFFVSAASMGAAAAAAPLVSMAQSAPAGAAPAARRAILKNDARLLNIGATVRSGNYWDFTTFMTPVEEFYVRNHYPTPLVEQKPILDPKNWKLKIHGNGIDKPIEITYDQLLKMPSKTIVATMECHGNGRSLFWEQQGHDKVAGGNWVLGAIGQAEWQYVPMSHIFALVGLKPNAKSVLFWSGVDGNDMGRPVPVSEITSRADDIGICFNMNGNPLTADHGGPVRVIVPGWGGTASIKWLTEMKIDTHHHWVRLNTKGEVYIGPDYKAPTINPTDEFIGVAAADVQGPMVTWMPIKSFITVPLVLEKSPSVPANYPLKRGEVPKVSAGRQVMRGYAWAPQHGIWYVEYRVDGGMWQRANLRQPNLGKYTWVRFDFPWDATPGNHVIETRGTDSKGNSQPATVPFNQLGMANGAVPKFKIQVV
ncbi:MAG: molybdopterin-dependent oxidoreductase [Burkholderiales bacterium]|jgi:sulfane dehydrogenase subunit SoxC